MQKKTKQQIKEMHKRLDKLPRMKRCENIGNGCFGRIERHHAIIYSGRKMEEEFALRALCANCHRGNNGTINPLADAKAKVNAITEGMDHLKTHYPKRNWLQEKQRFLFIIKQYGG